MLKRRITIIMTAILLCSMTACSQGQTETDIAVKTEVSASEKLSDNDTSTEIQSEESSEQSSETQNSTTEDQTKKSDNTANTDQSGSAAKDQNDMTDNSTTSNFKRNKMKSEFNNESNANTDNSTEKSDTTAAQKSDTTDTSKSNNNNSSSQSTENNTNAQVSTKTTAAAGELSADDIFSNRDLTQTADTSSAKTITVTSGNTINITEEGVYVITGTASECTIRVEADKEAKVQLVLDGVNITNTSTPAIYVVSADKCFITSTGTNSLSVTGTFTADGDTNTDAVIFSKDDIVLNGTGSLTINSASGNGISGKDDLKITGGTYNITSAKDAIEANDSIAVYDGNINITSSKDGLHSENDDDNIVGWIYICGGTFNIKAASDAIQATTLAQIDGGTFDLNSSEGIEATYIQINDGTISIYATDDGINAARKSTAYSTPTIEINGGDLNVEVGPGDTDAIDANGNIIVNGGTINVTAQMSSFDYDGTAQYNGGTIIINGTQVNSIPQSMMGGGMRGGMGNMGNMGGMNGRNRMM